MLITVNNAGGMMGEGELFWNSREERPNERKSNLLGTKQYAWESEEFRTGELV